MILEEMQAAVDRLCAAMVAKGVKQPKVEIDIVSNEEPRIHLWGNSTLLNSFYHDRVPDLIAKAEA